MTVRNCGQPASRSNIRTESANLTFNDSISIGPYITSGNRAVWNRETGLPLYNALVWQDGRAAAYCEFKMSCEYLRNSTGLEASPFFCGT